MVSFQCDGCADVVKKKVVDKHRLRCKASFTCIDCSNTFPTPADWKGHTSCISEAEKYQKSLYKPKQNGQAGRWMPRSHATGANGTPLGGTSPRLSPTAARPEDAATTTIESNQPAGQKRKADEIDPVEKHDTHKDKKQKSDTPTGKDTTTSAPLESDQKEKKRKRKKKDVDQEASADIKKAQEKEKQKEKKKRRKDRKKSKKDDGDGEGKTEKDEGDVEEKSKKAEKKEKTTSLQATDHVKATKEKKLATSDAAAAPDHAPQVDATEGLGVDASQEKAMKKKEKKEKKERLENEKVASSKESKKRKRKDAVDEGEKKKNKKKKESTA